jgi:hypothetical protein
MKQTAVEWLWEQYNNECDCGGDVEYTLAEKLFEQAKAMEKEQIIKARINGDVNGACIFKIAREKAEQYYNETYESKTNL